MKRIFLRQLCLLAMILYSIQVFATALILNDPYPDDDPDEEIYYSSFNEQPRTLDPAESYSANEYQFIGQIYEPLLQYDYRKRPYTLIPLTLTQMPEIKYIDQDGKTIRTKGLGKEVAYTIYKMCIQKGIYYQPHPAFAKNKWGQYYYHDLGEDFLYDNDIVELSNFEETGTRELKIDDYIYQIKRMANPATASPIYGLLSDHIAGFAAFAKSLPPDQSYIDLRKYDLAGVKKINDYCFTITIQGVYAQFPYWLAMPFFSPIPWEADVFYSQPYMLDENITFDWYPVGTGPFMLVENDPNREMILQKNPNYRDVYFPGKGTALQTGKKLPLINRAVYMLEKENIPRWNKFLQGYYDTSGVSADSFDQAIHITSYQKLELTPQMQEKKLHLIQTGEFSDYYYGFNMLDPIVGGKTEKARKLRQAISIAINIEEQIAIFQNGRGHPAQGPLPPGIFGYEADAAGINPYVYTWDDNQPKRLSIEYAKKLMKEAGYPNGIDPATGNPLVLHYDVAISGGPDDKAQLDWMRKQFTKIGIDLNVRGTLYNIFQEKMRSGNTQIYSWGWFADYPDPENFFFLFYGPNGKVKHGGENASNYDNPEFNQLFNEMKNRNNDAERQALINRMLEILRHDAPWVFGFNGESLILRQNWVSPTIPNVVAQNTLQYVAINVPERNAMQDEFNKPLFWPMGFFAVLIILLLLPIIVMYRKQNNKVARRMHP